MDMKESASEKQESLANKSWNLAGRIVQCCTIGKLREFFKTLIAMQRNAAVVLLVFFLYKTGEALLEPSVKLYLYEKTCIEQLSNDPLICRHLNVNSELERLAQRTASSYIMWYRVLLNVPAILLSLLIGAWSDRFGRKLPMMLPCIGSMTCVFLYLFSMIDGAPTFPLVLIGATINGTFFTILFIGYSFSSKLFKNLSWKLFKKLFLETFLQTFPG